MNIIRMATGPQDWNWNLFNALGQVASWIAFLGLIVGALITIFAVSIYQFRDAKSDYALIKNSKDKRSPYLSRHRSDMLVGLVAGFASLGLSLIALGVSLWAVTPIEINFLLNAAAPIGYLLGIVLTILGGLFAFVSLVVFVFKVLTKR